MSKEDFTSKVVIVTGSSSGIGQSAAVLFAKAGASVTITGRSVEGLKQTKDLILGAGIPEKRIHIVQGSIVEEATQKKIIDETIATFGKIDVLINNAGGVGDPNDPRSMKAYDYTIGLNLKAPIALTELAIPHLEKTKGNIINVSSIAAYKTFITWPFYPIAKAGLDHFARNYAAILAPLGIRINNINPGFTQTPALDSVGTPEVVEKMKAAFISTIPLRRIASSDEMGEFMLFMASDRASYMTGECITIDGGAVIDSPAIKLD